MPGSAGHETGVDRARTDVAIAIITRRGKVLICQRRQHAAFAGYWEFPGGKREPGETVTECLLREVSEELALHVIPLTALTPIDHDYPAGQIRLHPFMCASDAGDPQPLACETFKWIDPADLKAHQFPPANEQLIDEAIAHLHHSIPERDVSA